MKISSILSFLTLLSPALQALAVSIPSADGPFAYTIDGKILCSEIIKIAGLKLVDGVPQHYHSYACLVDPSFTESGSSYIQLTLKNLDKAVFEAEHKDAQASGNTRLQIKGGTINRSDIVLPSSDAQVKDGDSHVVACPSQNIFYGGKVQKCHEREEPTLNWLSGPAKRKLAVNQNGNRSILVVRVTTTSHGAPSASAAQVSDQVFGPTDTDNIATQYAACSNNQLDFYAAAPTGLSLSATGVYDMTVSTASSSDSGDVANAVMSELGNAVLNEIDHLFVHVVSLFLRGVY